jgi:hypothetical protein
MKQVQEMPKPPHEVNPELAPDVSAVILKMMAKRPDDRYASADEVIKAVDVLQPPKSVVGVAQAPAAPRGLPRWALPAAVACGALALVGIALFAIGTKTPPVDPSPPVASTSSSAPPPSTATVAPPPVSTPPPPPVEEGTLRGTEEWLQRYKDKPEEQKDLADVFKRAEGFFVAIDKHDEKAIRSFLPKKPALPGMQQRWQETTDRFVSEVMEKKREGALEYATITNVEMSAVFGMPRIVLSGQVTTSDKAGGTRTSPPQDWTWVREAGSWVYWLDGRKRPK